MRRLLILVSLAACGRIGFDPSTDGGGVSDAVIDDGTYRAAVLSDRPVGYWRLGDAIQIVDEVGGPDGIATGGCAIRTLGALTGDPDRAVGFDGTCSIDLGPGFAFLGVMPFTVEAWISSEAAGGYEHVVTKQLRDEFDPIDGYALLDSPSGVYFERVTSTGGGSITPAVLSVMGRYTHAVGVFDGAQSHLYLDGAEIGPPTADPSVAPAYSAGVLIGAARRGSGSLLSLFRGAIDEVAIYDHALSAARVMRHYQIGTLGPQ